jgi:tetratricopeptide (TPR) repeat protein
MAVALALTLAGCGSSTPRKADDGLPPRIVAPEGYSGPLPRIVDESEVPEPQREPPDPGDRTPASSDLRVAGDGARIAEPEGRAERRRDRRSAEPLTSLIVAEVAEPDKRRDRRSERRAAEDAAAQADAAVAPVPEAAAAAYERALAAMRAENWLEAELELEQLTLEQPSYPGPHVNLAIVYLHDGRRDDARAALERALELEPGHAAANTQLGVMLREDGKFVEAEAAYRRALATDPEHALAHYNFGVLLDIYLRRTAEALEHYEQYQNSLAQPNETVARWIIDLRRRVGNGEAARVAQEGGQ